MCATVTLVVVLVWLALLLGLGLFIICIVVVYARGTHVSLGLVGIAAFSIALLHDFGVLNLPDGPIPVCVRAP